MPSLPLVAVLLTASLAASVVATVAVVAHNAAVPEPVGHLILQVEGDATALRVTRITKKVDACGLARLASPHEVVIRDAVGGELGRVPLDLSAFDLEPNRAGQPLRVEGCKVLDPHVAMLANVPHWPTAAALEIVSRGRVLGALDQASYAALLAQAVRR